MLRLYKESEYRSSIAGRLNSMSPLNIFSLLEQHAAYRAQTLNLIASENVMSPAVEQAFSLELSHRYGDYAETDVRLRKYTGQKFLALLDEGAQTAAQQLFEVKCADLRPLSGHIAGVAAIIGLCEPGDIVFELDAPGGGHRLAQKLSMASLCPLNVRALPLDPETYTIDSARAVELIHETKPKLVILGSSLFLFPHPVDVLAEAVHGHGGYLLFDASHVLGLIAGGAYPNPLKQGADVMTSSTHKTFAGPQGGLLLCNDQELYERIAPAIYPALVTNHHLHRLPALWAACEEWKTFGQEHAAAVVENAQTLARELDARGLPVVGKNRGWTQSHTVLVASDGAALAKAQAAQLEACGILVTPVGLPSAMGGACLRLGVQEVTRRGMRPSNASALAELIAHSLQPDASPQHLSERSAAMAQSWNQWRFTWNATRSACDS